MRSSFLTNETHPNQSRLRLTDYAPLRLSGASCSGLPYCWLAEYLTSGQAEANAAAETGGVRVAGGGTDAPAEVEPAAAAQHAALALVLTATRPQCNARDVQTSSAGYHYKYRKFG